jgi:restriction endonuclease S subunit
MLLLLLDPTENPKVKGIELQQIFNFISVASHPSEAEEAIVLDYSYANYVFTINIFPDELNLKKLDSKIDDVKLDDYLLFTKGSSAGKVAKIENLLFHKNHLRKTNIKIVPVTNTILVRKIESDSIVEGFHDLIVYALFFKDITLDFSLKNSEIYFETTFINNLIKKNDFMDQFNLPPKDFEDVEISLPPIKIQKKIVKKLNNKGLDSSDSKINSIMSAVNKINETKQVQFSLSIKEFKNVKINLPHLEKQRDLVQRFNYEFNLSKLPESLFLLDAIKEIQENINHKPNQ